MRKILVAFLALLIFVAVPTAASASSPEKSDQIRHLEAIQARLEALRNGPAAEAGTYVGLLSIEKEVIAPSALTISVGGPIRASSPLVGQVYGGDFVRDTFYLTSSRSGLTMIGLASDSNLVNIEIEVAGRLISVWGGAGGNNSVNFFYLPPQESARITLIYRAPAVVGKHLFLTAVYDGGEANEKG